LPQLFRSLCFLLLETSTPEHNSQDIQDSGISANTLRRWGYLLPALH